MPLSWNEIRQRAVEFAREWESETREGAEAQTFWNEFFEVFGMRRRGPVSACAARIGARSTTLPFAAPAPASCRAGQ